MKKLSLIMAFMLTALVASAQSLVGSWVTDLGDSDKEPMLCTITYNADNSLALHIRSDINDPDMGVITLAITVKGIYKQKGKTLTLKFDKNSLDLQIAKMNLKPEMKQAPAQWRHHHQGTHGEASGARGGRRHRHLHPEVVSQLNLKDRLLP